MSEQEFPRPGGRWCLDLVATLGRRHHLKPLERIPDPAALTRWLHGAGLPAPTAIDASDLAAVRELREALHRSFRAHMGQSVPDPTDVDVLNHAADVPDLAPRLTAGGRVAHGGPAPAVAAVMSTLARDGIDLLATAPTARVRECEHPDCSLLFFDQTQGNRRRWCSMQRCGNQQKVADYRGRRRAAP